MNRLAIATVMVAVMVGGGCDRKEADGVPGAHSSAAAVASAVPKVEKRAAISVASAQAALTAWVDAQNRNSFEDYQGLYGEPFVGIKRTGDVEKEFKLAGWLEDRRNLFQRNPQVTADNVKVVTSASTAIIEFDQTWKTTRFQDTGRKRLIFNRDPKDGKLRIGREEMLTSRAGAAKVALPQLAEGSHYFLKRTLAGFGAVVGLLGRAQATGRFTRVEFAHVQRSVNLDTAKQASQIIGKEFDVYSSQGVPCLMKAVGIVAVAEAFWSVDENDPDAPKQTWDFAGDTGTFLVADLKPVNSACTDPLWARLASLPKPVVYGTRKATAEELQRAVLALNGTAQGQEAQTNYLEERAKTLAGDQRDPDRAALFASPHWYESKPESLATVMTNPRTNESYINIETSAMGGPCGGLWALATFKITDQNLIEITPPSPITAARDAGYTLLSFLPNGAAQLEDGAQPVFFNDCLLYANNGTGWVPAKFASGPRLMCSC